MIFNKFVISKSEGESNVLVGGSFGKGVVNLQTHEMIPSVHWQSYYYPNNDYDQEISEMDDDYDGEEVYLKVVPNNIRFPIPLVWVYEMGSGFNNRRQQSLDYISDLLNNIDVEEASFNDDFSEDCYGTIKDIESFLLNNENSILLPLVSELQKTEGIVDINNAINFLGYSKPSFFGINIGDFCVYKNNTNDDSFEVFGRVVDIHFSIYGISKDMEYPSIVVRHPNGNIHTITLEDIINKNILFQTFEINTNKCSIVGSFASVKYFKNQDLKRTLNQACNNYLINNSEKNNKKDYLFKILDHNSERLFYDCKLSVVNNCSYDGLTHDVVEVSYGENLTTKFLLCDVEFEYIPIPLNIKYTVKKKKIQVKQGVSLVLKKNKNFPSLPINKEYKIEVYIPSKISKDTFYNKNRVVITHNEKTLIVPLSYFKIPYVNSNKQNNKLEKAEVII